MGRMGRVGGRTRSSSRMATESGKRKCEKKRVVWHLRLVPYSYTSCRQSKGGLAIEQPGMKKEESCAKADTYDFML